MKITLPTPEMAIFMQKMMVFIELAMGLAILFGLFTWLASFASAGFLTMFILTAMLGWDQAWALPASIALMNGAGRTLDRKSTRLNSSHVAISYAVFCLKKKNNKDTL